MRNYTIQKFWVSICFLYILSNSTRKVSKEGAIPNYNAPTKSFPAIQKRQKKQKQNKTKRNNAEVLQQLKK